jgi:septal ring factor EnvC (AmiA/AmiB activator)
MINYEQMIATVLASLVTGGLGFLAAYLMYRYQINKDIKADVLELAKVKSDADGALFLRLSNHLRELDQNLKEVRQELEEERDRRRALEFRVDVLESEKARLSHERDEYAKERDEFAKRSNELQVKVNELQALVEKLTKEMDNNV